jgi:hypothetical protein
LREQFSGSALESEIIYAALGSSFQVQFGHKSAVLFGPSPHGGGRLDEPGSADDKQYLAGLQGRVCLFQNLRIETFPKPDDVGPQEGAALLADRQERQIQAAVKTARSWH